MNDTAIRAFARSNKLFLTFAALAVALRLLFWFYTGRVWEDALISMAPARNLWEGHGLTHHLSEPRVHSFTSALGEYILIIGEGFGSGYGLLAMRLASLVAAVAAIYFANRIGSLLKFHWAAQVMVLGYLATDHLQIFFGMAGVETQVATALILANVHFFLTRRWTALGLACGAALICRPEFAAWVAIVGAAMLLFHRDGLRRVFMGAAAVAGPWLVFATWYYGSAVPHTVLVKAEIKPVAFRPAEVVAYILKWPLHIAPFAQYIFVDAAPLPETTLRLIAILLALLACWGAFASARICRAMFAVTLLLVIFVVYRTATQITPYFMWYMPPFVAILFLLAGSGITALSRISAPVATTFGLLIFLAYALPLPFTLQLDRAVQREIEEGVRVRIGRELNAMMGPDDAVFLEPLGFIGWEIPNRTTYDYPGLSSPKAFAAYRATRSMPGVIDKLRPEFLVLRPFEIEDLKRYPTGVADSYEIVTTIKVNPAATFEWGGLHYSGIDNEFSILKRR